VYLTSPPGDTARLFVVEQAGRIRVLRHDTLLATPFLDVSAKIGSGGERGLLSVAFHPDYESNGRFYVYFTTTGGDIRVVRYNATTAETANESSADTVLTVPHPVESNHNGGQLQFGPDGMLWAGTGDGGGGGDPDGNGQNKHALLGKLLRLDVNGVSGYTIPAGNPGNADTSFAPEVWSYGLRNPWRFSFDRETGDLYVADVGQGQYEEVNVATTADLRGKGLNFGWNVMEGLHCYNATTCDQTGKTLPVIEYTHAGGACSITGGFVYRGTRIAALVGQYFYSDYCASFVKSFQFSSGAATNTHTWPTLQPEGSVSSFGQDAKGELYILTLEGGVYRIVPGP
jgi:glucose/arabinose dehydrogenase